uniref:Early endosome antigen 1 n=1 Tax=Phallusia mammillata TaxID=59560 RepID=A0A6F9DRT7_9ASCI|nr:early endosome antigen 1 [Phallusia mammillata]
MGIKTIAVVEKSSGVKTSNGKVVLSVDKRTEKDFKFDAVYDGSNGAEIFTNHVSKSSGETLAGINLVVMQIGKIDNDPEIVAQCLSTLFKNLEKDNHKNEHLVAASMLEVTSDSQFHDLINPHPRNIEMQHHSNQTMFLKGLSSLICDNCGDLLKFYEDGQQVSKNLHHSSYATVFSVKVLQRKKDKPNKQIVVQQHFVTLNPARRNIDSLKKDLTSIIQKNKPSTVPGFSDLLTNLLLGSNNVFAFACIDSSNAQDMASVLPQVEALSGIGSNPKPQSSDNMAVMQQLRQEIDKVRNRLAKQSPPNKNDLAHMEKLISDLDETKHSSWDQIILRSEQFYEERKTSFANKGLVHILQSSQSANRENLLKYQKAKEKLSSEYKSQRQSVDKVSHELRLMVDNYTQLVQGDKQSGETQKLVSKIQQMKEQLRQENEKLSQIQEKMKDVNEKLEKERQIGVEESSSTFDVAFQSMVEDRQKTKQENEQMVEDQLQKMKMQVEHDKAEIKMKLSSSSMNNKDMMDSAVELASLRAEKAVMTTQLEAYRREKGQMEEHMRILAEKHARELEIQQLQNLQTFRAYREVFEEFKVELENRWRGLLDDAIQDAVFLNARNSELTQKNVALQRELDETKDDRSMKRGLKS